MNELSKGDEQFDAFRQLHRFTKDMDTEMAAYVLENFCGRYYLDGCSPAMALAEAKRTWEQALI